MLFNKFAVIFGAILIVYVMEKAEAQDEPAAAPAVPEFPWNDMVQNFMGLLNPAFETVRKGMTSWIPNPPSEPASSS